MIQIEQVSLHFGDRVLFDDVSLHLSTKYRYILIGPNGSGKSAFLSLLAKERSPTLGEILLPKSATVGWMRQDHHLYDHLSLLDVVMKGRKKLWEAMQRKKRLLASSSWGEKEALEVARLEEQIQQLEGYRAEADAQALLQGLGIDSKKFSYPLRQLSGGWKMRVLLAQLLFNNPDILLLDEPTNYLDIQTIGWLERYLIQIFQGLLIVVSHDEHFLQTVGTCVLDVDYGTIQSYPGTYKNFTQKKEEIAAQKEKEYAVVEEKAKKMQRFIDRFKNKPSKASQAMSKLKMLEKLEWPELGRSSRKYPSFYFQPERPSGKRVLKAAHLCKMYEPDIFIGPLDLEIFRGERICFFGANGGGKTTLIHLLVGKILPDEGSVEQGHFLKTAIFYQEHQHLFQGKESLMEWLEKQIALYPEEKRRQVLGSVLFSAEDVHKKISMLSGGEMARLLLAKIMLSGANLLVLDEPTSHLDLESKESLAKALCSFSGTVLFVSHDRDFIEKVATRKIFVYRDQIQISV